MGGALVVALQTPPDTAATNAAKWVAKVTGYLPHWPAWTDAVGTAIGVLLILVPLAMWAASRRGNRFPERHAQILQNLADELAEVQNLSLAKAFWNSQTHHAVRQDHIEKLSAARTRAQNLSEQIPYDPNTMQTVRDFLQAAQIVVHDALQNWDDRESRADLDRLSKGLFRSLHDGRAVNRWRINLPDWCFTDAEKKTLRYKWRHFWRRRSASPHTAHSREAADNQMEDDQKAGEMVPDPPKRRRARESASLANLRATAQAVLDEAEEQNERAAARLSAFFLSAEKRAELQREHRRNLIASGRDLVQRYRDEGMPEPFGAFVVRQRPYLDIQPHLGNDYVRDKIIRAERPDTPAKRDLDSADFLQELRRLEEHWEL